MYDKNLFKSGGGINDIKLNRFGVPIIPENQSISGKSVITSNSNRKNTGLKGYEEDPTYLNRGAKARGIIEKIYGIPYWIQRKTAREFNIFATIVKLRKNQAMQYCRPHKDKDTPGIAIRLKDKDKKPSDKEMKEMYELLQWIIETGRRDFEGSENRKDRLPQFMAKLVLDVLALDRVACVIRRDRSGEPVDFAIRDAETIKPVDQYQGFDGDKNIKYVQEIDGKVVDTFKEGDIIVDWMYKTSDVRHQHFGWSGIEETFNEIKSTLQSFKYNRGNFDQNKSPRGFFSMSEQVEEDVLDDLEERWSGIFTDPGKLNKIMFFAGSDIKWNSINPGNRDMEFDKWVQLLLVLLFANYGVDPEEFGIKLDKGASVFGDRDTKKSDKSKDRGLGALLDFSAYFLNRIISTSKKWDPYELYYTARDSIDKDTQQERDIKKITNTHTVYEVRKEADQKQLWELVDEIFTGDELSDEEKKQLIKSMKKDSLLIFNAQYLQGKDKPEQEGAEEPQGEYEEDEEAEYEEGEEPEGEEGEEFSEEEGDFEEIEDEELEFEEKEPLEKSMDIEAWVEIA